MPVPRKSVEEFAADIRSTGAFAGPGDPATVQASELIAASAFDFAKSHPFEDDHGDRQMTFNVLKEHALTHICDANDLPRHACSREAGPVGLPPLLLGIAAQFALELAIKAAASIAWWLIQGGRKKSGSPGSPG